MAFKEYGTYDALGLADLVRRRQVTAAELVDEAIARAERVDPRIGALITPLHEDARRAARAELTGPFAGVPFLLKDLYADIAGVPALAGSRFLTGYRPERDSTIVQRFQRAGLIPIARTKTPELGLLPITEPEAQGPTRNPWNPALTPGGSSGGSAAAVAAGIVPAAHANDGGGSIRIPSACCGLFGLKPTRGRTPVGPEHAQLWNGFTISGVITRSVRDSAALLDAIAGPEPASPYWAPPPSRAFLDEVGAPPGRLRIALAKRPQVTTAPLHPDCAAAVDDTARLLADLGHHVEEADPDLDPEAFARDFFTLVCVETASFLAQATKRLGRRPRRGDIESATALTALIGRQRTALEAALARERLDRISGRAAELVQRFDLILSPALATPPPPLGAIKPSGLEAFGQELLLRLHLGVLLRIPGVIDASVRRVFSFIPFSPLANVAGLPAMSVPLSWNAQGLPIGSQLMARLGDEATLFRVAAQLEQARPWRDRRPPIHADEDVTVRDAGPPAQPEAPPAISAPGRRGATPPSLPRQSGL
ncbi:MAG TPA: amidase [Polyangia bacterium]|nr:amidase [Polyangia bacterium]